MSDPLAGWTREEYLAWLQSLPPEQRPVWEDDDWENGFDFDIPVQQPGAVYVPVPVYFQPGVPRPIPYGNDQTEVPFDPTQPSYNPNGTTAFTPDGSFQPLDPNQMAYNPDGTPVYAPDFGLDPGDQLICDRQLLRGWLASFQTQAERDLIAEEVNTLRVELPTWELSLRSAELFWLLWQQGIFFTRPGNYITRRATATRNRAQRVLIN